MDIYYIIKMVNDMLNMVKNKNGFTLIELLAVLILLAIVLGFGGYSIINVLTDSRENNYKLLIENINSAVEEYYIECKYSNTSSITCPTVNSGWYQIKLGDLVKYGFLKGNLPNDDGTSTLVNPKDNKKIDLCEIKYSYNDWEIIIVPVNQTGSCPTSY